jgi:4-hydroxy-2-oxoheptanedioate aldolase
MVDLRQRWSEGQPCHGLWSMLPGAVTGEVLARTGADFVVVDLQHGAVAEAELPGVTAAITAGGSVPLVRTRSPAFADVGRPLDLGACGVIVPNVRDADHAREVVAATRYAPAGGRSVGRLVGGIDEPLVICMVESASALEDLGAVLGGGGPRRCVRRSRRPRARPRVDRRGPPGGARQRPVLDRRPGRRGRDARRGARLQR